MLFKGKIAISLAKLAQKAVVAVVIDKTIEHAIDRYKQKNEKEAVWCVNCGRENVNKANFCHNCGSNLHQR